MKASNRTVKILLIILGGLSAVFFLALYLIWFNYRDRVYPGVQIGDLDLGGLTKAQAEEKITQQTKDLSAAGIIFQYNQKTATLPTNIASFDADLSYPTLVFDPLKTTNRAYREETSRGFFSFLGNLLVPASAKRITADYSLNQAAVRSFLGENFPELNIPPANAYFSGTDNDPAGTELKINPEKLGKEINYEEATKAVTANLDHLQKTPIHLQTRSEYPTVKQSELTKLEPLAREIVGRNFNLKFSDQGSTASTTKYWNIDSSRLINWLSVAGGQGQDSLSLDAEKIKEFLKTTVAPTIDREAVQPRFEIRDGKVSSWQTGQNGRAVDLEQTAAALTASFFRGETETEIITKEITDVDLTADNSFQIKEIIGTGHSNFRGSPVNRRHNISVGAAALSGLLIKPNEEFSLVKALGDISAKTGYRPELVIKGNKTTPEFGGGLCQIGTTVFRTALSSGLPITMRQNHSYRVVYYEPAGTDATIYDPLPDLRFINDTGNYILIQSRQEKDDLYFDFWGVKDGRVATMTAPVIYNIVKPEPTKMVETDELQPGQKKCTESSHNGADAYFDYIVTYPDNSTTSPLVQERRFKSHYIPWQAVCLIGKSATSTATGLDATSTPSTGDEQQKATGTPAASSTTIKP